MRFATLQRWLDQSDPGSIDAGLQQPLKSAVAFDIVTIKDDFLCKRATLNAAFCSKQFQSQSSLAKMGEA